MSARRRRRERRALAPLPLAPFARPEPPPRGERVGARAVRAPREVAWHLGTTALRRTHGLELRFDREGRLTRSRVEIVDD